MTSSDRFSCQSMRKKNHDLQYAELLIGEDEEKSTGENYPSKQVNAFDLLSMARQITLGMEYLSNNKIVHRDLAARNILLTENRTVKISDFGLSRDIYERNLYRKSGGGKLPFKWLAPESLLHQIYTSKSDVWSFGVLLWEIVTLGGSPYPGMSANEVVRAVIKGYKMEKPDNCSKELYIVMLSCWEQRPADRATFTQLREQLEKLMEDEGNYLRLDEEFITQLEEQERCASLLIPHSTSSSSGYGEMVHSDMSVQSHT